MELGVDIENYYEHLLIEAIKRDTIASSYSQGTLADFCCTVLNQLPAKYIRSKVDLAFFQTEHDIKAANERLAAAIAEAHRLIDQRQAPAR